jgi:hypothetical protein
MNTMSQRTGQATVDPYILSSDIASGGRDQKAHRFRHLRNGPVAPHRYLASFLIPPLNSVNMAGQDIVHPHTGAGVPLGVKLSETPRENMNGKHTASFNAALARSPRACSHKV